MSEDDMRGILTPKDKAWLRGEIEYQHSQSKYNRQQIIQERVSSALRDFALLVELWSPEERQKALDGIDKEQSAAKVIEFLYLALNEPASDANQMVTDETTRLNRMLAFRRALSRGIRDGKAHFGDTPKNVLIDSNTRLFETPSEEEIFSALDAGQWRNLNDYVRKSHRISPDGDYEKVSDETTIKKEEAAKLYRMDLHLSVSEDLHSRRMRSSTEIKRYDDMIGSL